MHFIELKRTNGVLNKFRNVCCETNNNAGVLEQGDAPLGVEFFFCFLLLLLFLPVKINVTSKETLFTQAFTEYSTEKRYLFLLLSILPIIENNRY